MSFEPFFRIIDICVFYYVSIFSFFFSFFIGDLGDFLGFIYTLGIWVDDGHESEVWVPPLARFFGADALVHGGYVCCNLCMRELPCDVERHGV